MKYDIIAFGSAALDLFLETDNFFIEDSKKFGGRKAICFPFAEKVDIAGIAFASGGGGTNTAATFSLHGLKTAFCGAVGNDFAGYKIIKELEGLGIDASFAQKTGKAATNLSVIFPKGKERTCFVWRGASEHLLWGEVDKQALSAQWFYLAPLSGKLSQRFGDIVRFAKRGGVKVFANIGNSQIGLGIKELKPVLDMVDILLLNQEEASLLTGIPYQREEEIFQRLDELVSGLAIMTKGRDGAIASDGSCLWEAEAPKVKVVEKTGAGDAFGSGFLAGYIRQGSVESGLQIGTANAVSCIQARGAKQGLLKKDQSFKKIKVARKIL